MILIKVSRESRRRLRHYNNDGSDIIKYKNPRVAELPISKRLVNARILSPQTKTLGKAISGYFSTAQHTHINLVNIGTVSNKHDKLWNRTSFQRQYAVDSVVLVIAMLLGDHWSVINLRLHRCANRQGKLCTINYFHWVHNNDIVLVTWNYFKNCIRLYFSIKNI